MLSVIYHRQSTYSSVTNKQTHKHTLAFSDAISLLGSQGSLFVIKNILDGRLHNSHPYINYRVWSKSFCFFFSCGQSPVKNLHMQPQSQRLSHERITITTRNYVRHFCSSEGAYLQIWCIGYPVIYLCIHVCGKCWYWWWSLAYDPRFNVPGSSFPAAVPLEL